MTLFPRLNPAGAYAPSRLPVLLLVLILALAFGGMGSASAQTFTVLHEGTFQDGGLMSGDLVLADGVLYGTAPIGGLFFGGTVFKINTDGTGFTVLKHFGDPGIPDDGTGPAAGMVLSGSTLYGTTQNGGSEGSGTVFKIGTDGSGYEILKSFTPSISGDGRVPDAGLVLSGSVLYGTTTQGGTSERGTIFKINIDGSGYAVLRNFTGYTEDGLANDDGEGPMATLILNGTTLYGMTAGGGNFLSGTIFKIETDGSGYQILKHLDADVDGAIPTAGLVHSGGVLYGTTSSGGIDGGGTIFKINADGTGFQVWRHFTGEANDGGGPNARMFLDGSTLYGTTQFGGAFMEGTIFKIQTDGSGFAVVKDFGGESGSGPASGVILSGGSLYGATPMGGIEGFGTVFSLTVAPQVNNAPTDIALSNTTIVENNAANATIGTLSATDPDSGQSHTFTLVSGAGATDNGAFTIVGNALMINGSADFEAKNSYSIRVRATDNGTPALAFEKQFAIAVTDVNEAPTDIALSNSTIAENNAAIASIGTLSATDPDSGQSYTFALVSGTGSTDNGAFTIAGTTLTIDGSADYEVKNSYSIRIRATDNGTPAASYEEVFTIAITDVQNPQTIAFDSLIDKTFGDAPITVTATASSGMPVSFSIVSVPANATISGNTVTLTGAGIVTIRASQPGGNDYDAATPVDQSFTVAKAEQTITFDALPDRLVEESPFTLTATASSGLPVGFSIVSGPATISGGTVTLAEPGEVTVRASQAGNTNYNAATDVEQSFLVSRFTKMADFTGADNGANPFGNLYQASDGNFYGTTFFGGANNLGTVFRMTPAGIITKLADFSGTATGANPADSLMEDSDGNLWGLTVFGGANNEGAVFKITSAGVLTRMASFSGTSTGARPFGGLAAGDDGNFYGMTSIGGANNLGTIFKVTPQGELTRLMDFDGANNGAGPLGSLSRIGTSYFGVTAAGGVNNKGLLFLMTTDGTPDATSFTKFADFDGASLGAAPKGNILLVPDGDDGGIYVLTADGGTSNQGALVRGGFGSMKLADFNGSGNGANPHGALVRATNGNFFGLAYGGGASNKGTIFRLTPAGTFSTMASFPVSGSSNGANPFDSLMQAADGAFYGTTSAGGANNLGTVFKLEVGLPVQNHAPTDITITSTSVLENTTTVGTLSAVDVDDGQTNAFTLVAGPGDTDNAAFVITNSTLMLRNPVDFETGQTTFSIRVRATDNGSPALAIEKVLSITVTDGNEAPTGIVLSNTTIAENNAINATVGTLSATDFESGQSYTFTLVSGPGSTDNSSFTITGSNLTINVSADFEVKNSYSIRIRVTDDGDPAGSYETNFSITITDVLSGQTITFGSLADKIFGDAPFTVSATASSGLPVNFSILDGPATISGDTVTITAAGTVTVRASQSGGNDFTAATPVDQTFTVARANQTITFNPPASKFYEDDPPFNLSATASSGLPVNFSLVSGPATLSGNTVTLTGIGTVMVRATQPGNTNFNAAPDETRSIEALVPPNRAPSFTIGYDWTPRGLSGDGYLWAVASSADGSKLVAASTRYPLGIFTSTDAGVTWVSRMSTDLSWTCVASSADGTKLVAGVSNGNIYTSTDAGATWVPRDSVRNWQSVASSADGTRLVAAAENDFIYTSTDSGVTWTPRWSSGARPWTDVASSADGTRLVAVAFNLTRPEPIYTSTDSGATWVPRASPDNWKAVASSADGTKLVAVASFTGTPGRLYTSTDAGVTWVPRESARQWSDVASSADGTRLVACAWSSSPGERIYTSADSGITWTAGGPSTSWLSLASSADGTKLVAASSGDIFTSDTSFRQAVADGVGPQIVSNLVQNIYAGRASESNQVVSFFLLNNNNGLFDVQPSIDASNTSTPGTLRYTPKAGQSGTATVYIAAIDDGPTTNGGVNISAAQSYTITVFPSTNLSGSDSTSRTFNDETLANTSGNPITFSGPAAFSGSIGVARGPITFSGTVTVNDGATLSVAGTNTVTISGSLIANPAGSTFVKTGSGTLVLDAANFNGPISVLEGTVVIKGANDDTCLTLGGSSVAQGNGNVNCIISKAGSTVRPGASPGMVSASDVIWEADANYDWEINNATGTVGLDPGWDLIDIDGALTISATTDRKFSVSLQTLTPSNVSGAMTNFTSDTAYSWRIVSAAGGITGFDPGAIALNTNGVINDLAGGSFTISKQNETDLVLSFIPASQQAAPTDIALSSTSIAEANSALTTIGMLLASDANATDNHTFTLVSGSGDTDNASFVIAGSALQSGEVFDYEVKNDYSVRVRVTDAGGLSFEKTFAIAVTDVVESATFHPGEFSFVDGKIQLKLEGTANTAWRIEASSDLITWTTIATTRLGLDGVLNFADPDSAGLPKRFYRAVLASP